MVIMTRPAGVPVNIWMGYEKTVFIPYIQKNAARLRRGLNQQDINYLTGALSNMLERSGISGLGAEDEIYGPPSPTPEKKGIDWAGMVENLFKAVPKVAESVMGYKLGKEALKSGGAAKPAVALPTFTAGGEGFPWMTIGFIAAAAIGGYFLLRRLKYI